MPALEYRQEIYEKNRDEKSSLFRYTEKIESWFK